MKTKKPPAPKYRVIAIPDDKAGEVFGQLEALAEAMKSEQGFHVPLWFAAAKAIESHCESRGLKSQEVKS